MAVKLVEWKEKLMETIMVAEWVDMQVGKMVYRLDELLAAL